MADTPTQPPVDLASLLVQASHALTTRLGLELADLGISARDYSVLHRAAQQERTQVEVADLVGLDKTTMVVTLDGLEKAGLARRRILPSDRRARVVEVTDAGRDVLARAHLVVAAVNGELLGGADPVITDAFLDCLTSLTARASTPPRRQVTAPQT